MLIGGLPATGKSTLARAIGEATGALVLRSDVVRKELAGFAPHDRGAADYQAGIYTPDATAATYAELLRRAEHALGGGEIVVIDASWTDQRQRADAQRLARDTSSDLVELRCEAPPEITVARIAARAAVGADPSDADAGVAAAMAVAADPWPTAVTVDTVADPGDVVREALRHVGPT